VSRGGDYSLRKRQRDADKARKKREKAERRMRKREEGPGEIPLTTAEEAAGEMPTVEEAMAAMDDDGGGTARRASSVPCRLFVGGLSWDTDEATLRERFGEFGPVTDAVVVKDRETGRSRGFGFVTMGDRKDAAKAMDSLHDSELDGRNIVVNVATERSR
jgi:hypothetical protein